MERFIAKEAEENGTICHSFTFNPPEMRRLGYGSPGGLIFEFLTVGRVTSVELRHRAKFLQNRSNRGQDM